MDVNAADFKELAARLKSADKVIARGVRKRLRDIAKPLGEEVRREGAEPLPSRGGLSSNLMTARLSVSVNGSGMLLALGGRKKRKGEGQLGLIDQAGQLRHPVFGNRRNWVTQSVPDHTFSRVFEEKADRVRDELARELDDVMRELAE